MCSNFLRESAPLCLPIKPRISPFISVLFVTLVTPQSVRAEEPPVHEQYSTPAPSESPQQSAEKPGEASTTTDPEQQAPPIVVVVHGVRQPTSASESSISRKELLQRPRRGAGDLVEAVPGLVSVQHAGGGKANQYFLRGFDIDHGTDLLMTVDRLPINMPSHGHGQGYADLHFIIPETISGIDVHKGPYSAKFGDFATAGALEMGLVDELPESQVSITAGQFGILRGLGILSTPVTDDVVVLLATELYAQDGPFENPEDMSRMNLLGRVRFDLTPTTTSTVTWMSYASDWNASGQLPLREVTSGRLDPFGSIDPSEGGATQRHSGSIAIDSQFDDVSLEATVYAIAYDWRLYSNFTFFLEDPENGDQIEQTDERTTLGTDLRASFETKLPWVTLGTTTGVQVRHDSITNALYHDVERKRLASQEEAHVVQSSLGFYVDELARFYPWLAARVGIRADRMQVDVEDMLDDPNQSNASNNGGAVAQLQFSPKASLILTPLAWLDMFVNFGQGFHSNDARGATRSSDPADLLASATGYEVGTRLDFWRPLTLSVVGYQLYLESEQVYVGDAGTTEPSDPSRRYGVEATGIFRWGNFFNADAALTLNRAQYRPNVGNGGAVALAPTTTFSGGVAAKAPFGTFGSVRVRHIGARPATEDERLTAEGWTVWSASVGHRQGPFELRLDMENIFNTSWREVQFATESRLSHETEPVEEIHFAPGWPFTAQLTLSVYL